MNEPLHLAWNASVLKILYFMQMTHESDTFRKIIPWVPEPQESRTERLEKTFHLVDSGTQGRKITTLDPFKDPKSFLFH